RGRPAGHGGPPRIAQREAEVRRPPGRTLVPYGRVRAPRPLRRRRSARGGIARLLLGLAGLCGLCSAALATEYIAFGDSITFGIGDETVPSEPRTPGGYPMRLKNLYAVAGTPIEMNNAGEPGEDTGEGLTRIDKVLNQSGSPGDVLLLMEGTNDIAKHIGIETTRFNLGEMSRKAEARGLAVVQATLTPPGPDARFDPQNILNVEIVEHIRDQAGRKNRVLVDTFEICSGLSNLFEKYYYHPTTEVDPVGHPN